VAAHHGIYEGAGCVKGGGRLNGVIIGGVSSLAANATLWSNWPGIYSRVLMVVMRAGAAQSTSRPSGEAIPSGERALVERVRTSRARARMT